MAPVTPSFPPDETAGPRCTRARLTALTLSAILAGGVQHAAANQSTASALLDQADTSRATAATGAPATATAAQSYPTPIKEVSAAQGAPKTAAAAPAARTATRKAPTAGRRR